MTDAKLTEEPELKDLCDFLQGRCDVAQVGKNEARIQVRVSDLRALISAARDSLESRGERQAWDEGLGYAMDYYGTSNPELYDCNPYTAPSAPSQPAESPWVAALEFESRAAVVTRSEMVSCSRGSLAWINAAETLSDHVEELSRILARKEPTNGR